MASPITVEEIAIPDTLDGPGADDFRAAIEIRNRASQLVFGEAAGTNTPEELLPSLQEQTYDRKLPIVARWHGEIVGMALIVWSVEPDTRVTWVEAAVDPAWRNRGIGTALVDHIEAATQAAGRPVVQAGGLHEVMETGPRIAPPTGYGTLPRDEPVARFLLNRGYTLEQVHRVSFLHLPVAADKLAAHRAAAQARAGDEYRLQTWIGDTPERWRDDMATIFRRMATDAPSGNLEIDEEPWDAERVRQNDERRKRAGRTALAAAIEHIPSGRLVAYNGLSVPNERSRPVDQGVTLVLKEHRGHRLGMLVKVSNIEQLQAFSPRSPFIMTGNAEENRPMLDVNEAVGFVPAGYAGAWKKTL